jgi:adenylate cyclase, class 2
LRSLDAEDKGTLLQEDTYFDVPRGRLKLRREGGRGGQLIAYERPDSPESRESHYRIIEVADTSAMQEVLADVLHVVAVVKKTRRLFLFQGVRIHLDRIEGLGHFIELEGVAQPDEDLAPFEALLADLRRSFGIEDADLLGKSYCDLALTATDCDPGFGPAQPATVGRWPGPLGSSG